MHKLRVLNRSANAGFRILGIGGAQSREAARAGLWRGRPVVLWVKLIPATPQPTWTQVQAMAAPDMMQLPAGSLSCVHRFKS